jgi:hypothetical protein
MNTTSSVTILLLVWINFQMVSVAPASAATRVWTNVVGNANWSNATNWNNGVPVDGDSVVLLRHPLGFFVSAVNDLTNLTLASIRCESIGYNLGGGTLRLTGEVLMGGPAAGANLNISAPVEIPGPTLNIVSTNGSELNLSGLVTASSGTVVTINGGIRWRAIIASDYRATTRLQTGFMPLLSTRLKGSLIVGGTTNFASVVLQTGNVFGEFPPLTILTNGSVINISTFQSVGALTVDGGVLRLGNRSPNGEITVNGPALLTGGANLVVSAINSFGPGALSVTGTVTIAGCSLMLQDAGITQPSILVRNDGTDPVIGTFIGLPEGSILTNNTVRYVLSYAGGDGNDIMLTPIIEPARFISSTLTNDTPQFLVQGQPGFTYVIEATTNLLSPTTLIPWVPIFTSGTRANGQFPFTDLDSTNFPQRFYRVVKP